MSQSFEINFQHQKILITGVSGFLGSWLAAGLLELGGNIFGIARYRSEFSPIYQFLELDRYINKVIVDITRYDQVYRILEEIRPHIVFHLAAQTSIPESLSNPMHGFNVNTLGALNFLEASRQLKLHGKILLSSSPQAFGLFLTESMPKWGFSEKTTVNYGGPYGTSKATMELIARSYKYVYSRDIPVIVIMRFANIIGNGDPSERRRVLPLFIISSLKGQPIPLKYLKNGRQFLYITDAIAGCIRAAVSLPDKNPSAAKQTLQENHVDRECLTYHFALEEYPSTDEPFIRMLDLAKQVSIRLGSKIDLSTAVDYAPNEDKILAMNCNDTCSALCWHPMKMLPDAIDELASWYRTLFSRNNDRNFHLKAYIKNALGEAINSLKDSNHS